MKQKRAEGKSIKPTVDASADSGRALLSGQELRKRAEALLREKFAGRGNIAPGEVSRLLNELEVHQIELEMQNEELRRAQEELEASRAKYFDLFDLAPVGYLTLSETGIILESNLTAANLLGVERSQLVKRPVTRFIFAEDHNIYDLHRKQLFETQTRQVCELRLMGRGGVPFWVHIEGIAKQGENDAPVCRATLSDISGRKRAEEALREREQRLASIYDTVGDVIFQLAVEKIGRYRFASVNQAFLATTGFTFAQVVGKPVNEIIPEPSLTLVLEKYREAIQEKRIVRWEETSEYPTGRITGAVSVAPVFDSAGNCIYLVGAVHDITERKQTEDALLESNEQLSMALEVSDAGIWKWNTKSDEVCFDDRFHAMLGYLPGELPNTVQEWLPYHHPEDMPIWMSKAKAYLQGDSPIYESEHRIRTKAGTWNWIFTRGKKVSRTSEETSELFIGFAMNVTELKLAEEEIARTAQEWQTTFDVVNDAIWLLDKEQRVLRSNKIAERLFQRPREEIIGKHCWEIVHGAAQPIPECPVLRASINLRREVKELQIGEHWFEITADPILDAAGRYGGAVHIISDITEHKRATEQLNEQLDELRRWNKAALGRETRIIDLKHEVNELLAQAGLPPRYPSAEAENP